MASTSSETPSLPGSNFDVFLSFRGEDTRHSFTDHLHEAFRLRGIEAFRDSEKLQLGQEIASELIQAIENSQYAIVVFSEKYADSRWCLDELAEIVECKKNKGLKVVPIFYHVDPSDVRKQTGPFEKAFDEHQKNDKIDREKIQKWKDAMREVGTISGEHLLPQQRSEAKCIKDIVEVISNKLRNPFSVHTLGLIGIESRAEKLKSHLAMESNDVRIIGIWGTGGMGKTTLARVVYGMVSNKFDGCCFIANVREESKKCGLCKLQTILLEKLLMLKKLNVQDVYEGVQMIKNRLHNKKILLVLDDINELDQLKKLAGENFWFGSGSRVMITTRDKHLLVSRGVNEIYEAKVLNHEEAIQLFSLKAFQKDHPPEDYGKLSQAFVDYSKGLPLALEVLGSFLFGKSIDEWKSGLDRLTKFGERTILNVLRISFDELQPPESDIFLFIACLFNHNNPDKVIKILDYFGLCPTYGLSVLINKSLVKLHEDKLWMHDLLQKMGQDIVHQQGPKDPGKRSILWSFKDIDNVLTKNTGTEAVQGIVLELDVPKKVDWNPEAFSKMEDLKLLKICGVQLMHDLKHLPDSLRVLYWSGYSAKLLPSSFPSKIFENLKSIEMKKSLELTEVPDISEVPNLENLDLQGCINLSRIPPSMGIHKKLTDINLEGCTSLTSLPNKFEMESLMHLTLSFCTKLKQIPKFGRNMKRVRSLQLVASAITKLPKSIEHLTDLRLLQLHYCNSLLRLPNTIFNLKLVKNVNLHGCSKLDGLPENLGNVESLEDLYLSETAIRKVPSSIGLLKNLKRLHISRCKGLSSSPHPIDLLLSSLSGATSLTHLYLDNCNLKAISNDIGSLFSLLLLDLSGNDFVCLPESIIRLSNLKSMKLTNCTSLRSLPELPLKIEFVGAGDCTSLEMLEDELKPKDSLELYIDLCNCFKLAEIQSLTNRFISGIEKSIKSLSPSLSLPLSVQKIESYPYKKNEILIPGSEISEWFSHQSKGAKVNIKEPSHLCNQWMGIAICVVFCSRVHSSFACSLTANGKIMCISMCRLHQKVLSSDHLWLIYLTPQFFDKKSKKVLWEGDASGFSQIGIKMREAKKCGIRMIYKKDIEDLDQTMAQCSNSSITPYDGLECHKVKRSRDDCDGAGPSGEGSSNDIPNPKMIKRHTETHGNSDSKDCDEELSFWDDWEEDNDDLDEDELEEDNDDLNENDGEEDNDDSDEYSENDQ